MASASNEALDLNRWRKEFGRKEGAGSPSHSSSPGKSYCAPAVGWHPGFFCIAVLSSLGRHAEAGGAGTAAAEKGTEALGS